jgi:AbiU2
MTKRKPQKSKTHDDTLDPVEKVHELMQTVHSADVCFEIWRLLTFKDASVDSSAHVRAFGRYSHFFMPSVHAHWIGVVMAIYRLFDSDPNAVSLVSSNELRQKLDSAHNQIFRRKLGSVRDIADRVAALRNHLFGHRDNISTQAAFDEAKLKRDELRKLINTSRELVEILRAAWDLPKEMWPQNDAIADTVRLLDRLGN